MGVWAYGRMGVWASGRRGGGLRLFGPGGYYRGAELSERQVRLVVRQVARVRILLREAARDDARLQAEQGAFGADRISRARLVRRAHTLDVPLHLFAVGVIGEQIEHRRIRGRTDRASLREQFKEVRHLVRRRDAEAVL